MDLDNFWTCEEKTKKWELFEGKFYNNILYI